VPGWHERTKKLQDEGTIQTVGIIQEQHPDRARLFMQWKRMEWPILVDSLNLLGVSAVPITLLIDAYGVIRFVRPTDEELRQFLESEYEEPAGLEAAAALPDLARLEEDTQGGKPEALTRYGDALVLWGNGAQLTKAIDAYEKRLGKEPEHGPTHFRLGVAYRKRYDSSYRQPGDFTEAVEHWGKALDIDPNQYIWRRRIQQYGPRLAKPYPFYDWLAEARREIVARGETPTGLTVEPGGAELAHPAESFETTQAVEQEPDPGGRIHRDEMKLIQAETIIVPSVVTSGEPVRVHVIFRPNDEVEGHWNNEAGEMVFWVNPPEGWQVDRRYQTVPLPPEPVSQEPRKVEFELKSPAGSTGSAVIPTYVLYYVCEGVNGTCLYRRQDVPVKVLVSDLN
jgi:hypothetical protein